MYCQRQRCSPRSVVSGDMSGRYSSGFAGEVVSNASAVVENASFLFRSLYLPYEVPHWIYISKFTRLFFIRTVSRRQHGSCYIYLGPANST